MSKPNFRPFAPLDVADEELDRVNDHLNVPVMVRSVTTTTSRKDVDTARRQAVKPTKRQKKLTVRIPSDLVDAMKRRALDQHTSVRHLLLLALQKDGYAVDAADLLPGAGGSD